MESGLESRVADRDTQRTGRMKYRIGSTGYAAKDVESRRNTHTTTEINLTYVKI